MAASGSVLITADAKAHSMVFAQRWAGFVTAIWLMALSGTYGFSNYSTALKEVLGLNQKQLNRISVAKDLGDSCGIIAGILSNYLPAQALLCIAACVSFVGNGVQWLVVSRLISAPPYWTMFIIAVLAGNTTSWLNASVFTWSVRNFPRNRGPVSGLYKAYMGLSAAIYSTISDNFFSSSASMYLLMLTMVPTAVCLITAIFLRPVPPSETPEDIKAEQHSIFAFTMISISLAVLLLVQNLVPGVEQGTTRSVLMVLLFVILAAPAFVPLTVFFLMKRKSSRGVTHDDEVIENTSNSLDVSSNDITGEDKLRKIVLLNQSDTDSIDASIVDMGKDGLTKPLLDQCNRDSSADDLKQSSKLKLGEDHPTLSLFKAWHMYVLYITLFCAAGSGMAFSNNLGQVGQSFGFSTVTLFTSLFSLGNFFGRIASGNASEYFLTAKGTPRPVLIGVAKIPMIALFSWLSLGSAISLYAGSFILGLSHGTVITLTIPTISEFYGLKYFGLNYMVINTHILAGSMIFSGVVAGYLYDLNATYQGDGGTLTCYGATCYGTTFRVFAGVLTLALVCDGVLTFFSRPVYKKLQDINTNAVPKQSSLK